MENPAAESELNQETPCPCQLGPGPQAVLSVGGHDGKI